MLKKIKRFGNIREDYYICINNILYLNINIIEYNINIRIYNNIINIIIDNTLNIPANIGG